MAKILIVEDDKVVSEALANHLAQAGFQTIVCDTLLESLKRAAEKPDLILLDWELPDGEGLSLLQNLRRKGIEIPIIFLTARKEIGDKILGLESGADDFVVKPFDVRELTARIRRKLRLSPAGSPKFIEIEKLKIDLEGRKVWLAGRELTFSKVEFDLLKCFMENPGKALARGEIAQKVWGIESLLSSRTIDTHVLNLRQKIGDDFIETLRGVGYRFRGRV